MKQIILFWLFIFSTTCLAESSKTFLGIGGSLSIHPFASMNETAQSFSNKLTKDGTLVLNKPTITLSKRTSKGYDYSKFTFIYSRDCVDSPVYLFAYSNGTISTRDFYSGFVIGGYFMNDKIWNERAITKSWITIHGKTTGPNTAIVPVIGWETDYRLLKMGNIELHWSNYLNPFLINSTISLGISF